MNGRLPFLKVSEGLWTKYLKLIWPFSDSIKVFSHNTQGGLFTAANVFDKNSEDPNADLFSILGQLHHLKINGSFNFRLCYPELKGIKGSCNYWSQSSNPATNSSVSDFRPNKPLAFTKNGKNQPWKGLGKNSASSARETFIDDTPTQSNWFSAVGAFRFWPDMNKPTIPGPRLEPDPAKSAITKVDLSAYNEEKELSLTTIGYNYQYNPFFCFLSSSTKPTEKLTTTAAPTTTTTKTAPTTTTTTTTTTAPTTTTTTAAPTTTTTPCSKGWTYLKHTGQCYKSEETRLNMSQAILACQAAHPEAHLAVIPDKTTNDFILSMVKIRSLIGLSKVSDEWRWADGTKASYTNWIPNEPSGDGSSVEMVRNVWKGVPGQWNDLPHDNTPHLHTKGYVCQYNPSFSTVSTKTTAVTTASTTTTASHSGK